MEAVFLSIGLTEEKARETAGNKKLSASLAGILEEAGLPNGQCDRGMGSLFYDFASTVLKDADVALHRAFVARRIANGDLKSKDQLGAAVDFCKKNADIDEAAFNRACGVGVEVGVDELTASIDALFLKNADAIARDRYRAFPMLLKSVKEDDRLRWADGKLVKDKLDASLLSTLGPKDERDVPQKKKKEKKLASAGPSTDDIAQTAAASTGVDMWRIDYATDAFFQTGDLSKLHKPGGNRQIKQDLMDLHLKQTGGRVITRFPPEPNGHLHIGHAKAINVNFGFAEAHGGTCNLRYDDTNPEAEEEEFFTSILDSVKWLGFSPDSITYSSDHFQRLYDLAVQLIKADKAYVCHCSGEEIHNQRGGDAKGDRFDSPWRNRPISESLAEFTKMKEGYYKEGEAVLRMKMDMQNGNPQMWDLIAFRVLFTPHFRTAKDWCIYPTYDYTHCLCDSFENITHSMCTTEFRASRESYYWLCDALEVYKPVQWEYGRLNITNTVLSKRKLTKLVSENIVRGWDDPRLYTLVALKRRGFPPEAINRFVRDNGVTTANTTTDVRKLEFVVRQYLDDHAPRVMAVLEPLPVLISNLNADHYEEFEIPFMPKSKQNPALNLPEYRRVPFTANLYIDSTDFKEDAAEDPNFFRLSVGSTVGLLNTKYPIYCESVIRDGNGKVVGLNCLEMNPETTSKLSEKLKVPASKLKPKAHIQWIALSAPTREHPERISSPLKAEIRLYNDLFLHANPMDKVEVPGGWLSDINPKSLEIAHAYVEAGVGSGPQGNLDLQEGGRVQFVRTGYFCVDKESKPRLELTELPVIERDTGDKTMQIKNKSMKQTVGWVWNRTVGLREDTKKD